MNLEFRQAEKALLTKDVLVLILFDINPVVQFLFSLQPNGILS